MDEYINSMRVRLSSLTYRELQKEAKENSVSARQTKVKIIAALIRKLSRDYHTEKVEREVQTDEEQIMGKVTMEKENDQIITKDKENEQTITMDKEDEQIITKDKGKERIITMVKEDEQVITMVKDNEQVITKDKENEQVITKDKGSEQLITMVKEDEQTITMDKEDEQTITMDKENEQIITKDKDNEQVITKDKENEQVITMVKEDEQVITKDKEDEQSANFYCDFDINTPTRAMPKLSYTPYKGSFRYVDTTKMSNRDFELYQQRKKEDEKRVLNERSASVGRNDYSFAL